MTCPVCHRDPCTCLETGYGPMTPGDWVESLNTSLQDLAYGKAFEEKRVMGFAGVRWANAWEAMEEASVSPQCNEEGRSWQREPTSRTSASRSE